MIAIPVGGRVWIAAGHTDMRRGMNSLALPVQKGFQRDLAAAAGEDDAKADAAGVQVRGFTRRAATRRNFPADLPRRRIVHPAPTCCPCCGGTKLSKIGEDIAETLDVVPRQWFVTEHVREKFSCRSCETITQPPAPFHAISRGLAGPSLLASDAGREARQPSATQPAERAICARGGRAVGVDHGGSCWCLCGDVRSTS
jgi:transposase